MGHGWDHDKNGTHNLYSVWYVEGNGKKVFESEKFSTWWENRIRAEHGIALRAYYSFVSTENGIIPSKNGSLLLPNTRFSSVINIWGTKIARSDANIPPIIRYTLSIPFRY